MLRVEGFFVGILGSIIGLALLSIGLLGLHWRSQPLSLPYLAQLLSGVSNWQSTPMNVASVRYRLNPYTVQYSYVLGTGLLILASTVLMLRWRRNLIKAIATAVAIGLCMAVMFAHFAMPSWSRFDIDPLLQLAERTRPNLEAGEPLVLYGIHPARTSVRFVLGHPDLITETTEVSALEHVVERYPSGQIITVQGDSLPAIRARCRSMGPRDGGCSGVSNAESSLRCSQPGPLCIAEGLLRFVVENLIARKYLERPNAGANPPPAAVIEKRPAHWRLARATC